MTADNLKYNEWILNLRKSRKLHSLVENQLSKIVSTILPDYIPVSEVQGLAGGRNDLILFEYSGRKVLFEIFASQSQVTRDLRILDKTKAEIKIAVLIDKTADKKVFEKFIRENPEDNYPYFFIRELVDKELLNDTAFKLLEIINKDDNLRIQRYLKKKYSKESFEKFFTKENVKFLTQNDIDNQSISLEKVLITSILSKFSRFGIDKEKLVEIGKILSQEGMLEFQYERMFLGLSVFIYTDFKGNLGFYSDNELQDFIHIGHELVDPYVLLSLNATLKEIIERYYTGTDLKFSNDIRISSGMSTLLRNENGNKYLVSVPNDTVEISILTPLGERENNGEISDEIKMKYLKMINIQ